MIRHIRRIVLRTLAAVVAVIAALLILLNLTWNFFPRATTTRDYSDWMRETLDGDRHVVEIAMLGAHDAFTAAIGPSSPVDPLSAASIQTGFTGALIKGFSIRQAKTQLSTAATLLAHGVRYFDIRLTFNAEADAWYVTHGYYGRPLIDDLIEIETFLAAHPGEFVILDIQHVYGVDYADSEALDAIHAVLESAGIIARAYRDDAGTALDELTYDALTAGQTRGGVLLFSKFTASDPWIWDYGTSIRSAWPNTDDAEEAFAFLTAEAELIASGEALTGNQISGYAGVDARRGLRVMQGVLTMPLSGGGILRAIGSWSLLARARRFNVELVAAEGFPAWLQAMPIVMVDYADSNHDGFNDDVMDIIVAYNQSVEI